MIYKTEIEAGNLSLPGATSVGVRAGPFLFFGAQTPINMETGRLVSDFSRDLPEEARRQLTTGMLGLDLRLGRILSQAWCIYHNLQSILARQGCSLDNVVRQRIFLKDMRDMASLEKVILAFMPNERPATTIVGATNAGANQEIAVQADFIVLANKAGVSKENISVPGLDPLTAPFPLATRVGQFIFMSAMAGADPETGRLVNRIDELSPDDREIAPQPYDAKEEAGIAQCLTTMRHIRRILESQGAPFLGSLIHTNSWLRFPSVEASHVYRARQRLFTGSGSFPVASGKFVSGVRKGDALLEYEIVAFIPPKGPADSRLEISMAPSNYTHWNVPALKAGPFVFTRGEVSSEPSVPRFISKFSDLEDEGRFLPYGRCHPEKSIMAQAWFVYKRLKSYTEAYGTSMENVAHQTVYMTNPADYPACERIATLFFGPKLPPTTVVPCLDSSPYPDLCELEIELVAVAKE
ncbi:Rid family hydrolase [Chloroflexota bacterium]